MSHCVVQFCLLLLTWAKLTNGYCNTLYVDDAEYNSIIEGTYYLYGYNCNGQPVWVLTYENNGVYVSGLSYIAFGYNNSYMNSNSNTFSAWVIGTLSCPANSNGAAAINQQASNTLPYNLGDTWYERNGSSQFVPSSSLHVSCSDGLTGWEIFGIVMGSICGFLLLISILACCCSKHRPNKRRTQNPAAVVYTTNGTRATCTVVTTSPAGGQAILTEPVYVINPPAYDNSNQPPAYEAISVVPTSLPPVNEPPIKDKF